MTVTASDARTRFHGDSLTLHSVIYPMDFCTSGCTYCGLSAILMRSVGYQQRGNMPKHVFDATLTTLVDQGYQVHELVFGTIAEDQDTLASRIRPWVERARELAPESYLIVNCDTLKPTGYAALKRAGADAIWTFIEVMDPELYRQKHLSGIKSDQKLRLRAPEMIKDAGMAVGNAILWGLSPDWQYELDEFVTWSDKVGGFDFVATPVQQKVTLPAGTSAPIGFDVEPPLKVGKELYLEICSQLRDAFPQSHLVANTRIEPEFVYGTISKIVDMCNGYVWTGAKNHPRDALAEPGHHTESDTQMDFYNPGSRVDVIQAMCPDDIKVTLSF